MNCKKAETYMVEYLYQELTAGKTVELEKHLKSCRKCAETLNSWRAVHRSYQKIADHPQPSPFLKQRILAVAGEELQKGTPWTERLWLVLKLAAVPILIFGVAMLFYFPQKEESKISQVQEPEKPAPTVVGGAFSPGSEEPRRALESDRDSLTSGEKKTVDAAGRRKDMVADDLAADTETGFRARESKEDFYPKEEIAESPDESYEFNEGRAYDTPAPAAPEPASREQYAEAEYGDDRQTLESAPAEVQVAKQKAASKLSNSPEGLYEQSQVLFRQNQLRSGVSIAKEAIKNDQEKSLAGQFHESGVDFQNKGEYENAIIQYNLVVSNYPGYRALDDVLMRLGDLYAQAGQLQDAESAYQRLSTRQGRLKNQKLQDLKKKQDAQEQLKALGYVKD